MSNNSNAKLTARNNSEEISERKNKDNSIQNIKSAKKNSKVLLRADSDWEYPKIHRT